MRVLFLYAEAVCFEVHGEIDLSVPLLTPCVLNLCGGAITYGVSNMTFRHTHLVGLVRGVGTVPFRSIATCLRNFYPSGCSTTVLS